MAKTKEEKKQRKKKRRNNRFGLKEKISKITQVGRKISVQEKKK